MNSTAYTLEMLRPRLLDVVSGEIPPWLSQSRDDVTISKAMKEVASRAAELLEQSVGTSAPDGNELKRKAVAACKRALAELTEREGPIYHFASDQPYNVSEEWE